MAAIYEDIVEEPGGDDIMRSYMVFVSDITIATTVSDSPNGIRTWIQNVREFIAEGGRCIAVASRIIRRRNPKILVCVFLIDNNCLIVPISNIKEGVLGVLSEFVLEFWNSYMGIEIEDVMHLLTPRLEWSDRVGRPTMININTWAAQANPLLLGANLHELSTFFLDAAPVFPIDVANNWNGTLTLGQIGTLVVEAHTIKLIGNALIELLGD